MEGVTARAPAKINLALRVGPLRSNGFHDVATVYQALSLHDEIAAEPADDIEVIVVGPESSGAPTDHTNLAWRAARLLATHHGVDQGARLTITKNVPVAAGLAGGSADAAAALIACDALWRTATSRDDLHALATKLGSDVPFSLVGGTAVGIGRGDRLSPALTRGEYHWALAFAEGVLSTPEVYGRLDALRAGHSVPPPAVDHATLAALRAGDSKLLATAMINDLQPAAVACVPALRRTLEAGTYAGALAGIVCGSGPTCAFLARDAAHALQIASSLAGAGVCRTVKCVSAPAVGARVVSER